MGITAGFAYAHPSKENFVIPTRKEVSEFIEDTKMSKTATVERALTEFIEKYNKTGKI